MLVAHEHPKRNKKQATGFQYEVNSDVLAQIQVDLQLCKTLLILLHTTSMYQPPPHGVVSTLFPSSIYTLYGVRSTRRVPSSHSWPVQSTVHEKTDNNKKKQGVGRQKRRRKSRVHPWLCSLSLYGVDGVDPSPLKDTGAYTYHGVVLVSICLLFH